MKGISKQSDVIRKGQAATEFLMTYGWAILAIVIVAAVLWNMGVFKGQCAKTAPVQVFGSGEQLQASDWAFDTNNDLTMSLKNLAGSDISITEGTLYFPQNVVNGTLAGTPISVPAGSDKLITISGGNTGTTGNCFTADVSLVYTSTGGVAHNVTGTIRGKY